MSTLFLQIISTLVAGAGGLLGILSDFKYDEGPKKGQVTPSGKWAISLLLIGIVVNIITTTLDSQQKDDSERKRDQQSSRITLLSLQERQVRSIQVVIYFNENVQDAPSNWALLTVLKSRNGVYLFTIPYEGLNQANTLLSPETYIRKFGENYHKVPKTDVIKVNSLAQITRINLTEVGEANWILPIFGDLSSVEHYLAVSKAQYAKDERDAFNKVIPSIKAIAIFLDDFPVHIMGGSNLTSVSIVQQDEDKPSIQNVMLAKSKFYRGEPNWSELSRSGDPIKVIPKNKLLEAIQMLEKQEKKSN